jgi:Holliday junction resolvase RusA-like endonuclease
MIQIEILGAPIALKRPRTARIGNFINIYNPQKKELSQAKWQIKAQYKENPIPGPLLLDIVFYMPIPIQTSKVKTREMINGILKHQKKPDLDNLQKFILDAMNGIVFIDDSQVDEIKCRKTFATQPRTLIRVLPH